MGETGPVLIASSNATAAHYQASPVMPLSQQAGQHVRELVKKYESELLRDAEIMARRQEADSISATHVHKAAQSRAETTQGRFARHSGLIGTTLIGLGAGALLTLTHSPSSFWIPVLIVLAVSGAGMFGFYVGRN